MDPTSIISHIITIIDYVQKATKQMRCNDEECEHLARRAKEVLALVEAQSPVPVHLKQRLLPLTTTFSDLQYIVKDLVDESLIKRLLWRNQIEEKIAAAAKSVRDAIEAFHLGTQIDIVRFQAENEAARRADAENQRTLLVQLQSNNQDILRMLGITSGRLQDAMISVYKRIGELEDTFERRFWERSMSAMQRVSDRSPKHADDFNITSLEVIVHKDAKLGVGGFSSVCKGEYLGTVVAVKTMAADVPKGALQEEIDVWKNLRHPHVLQFIGACRDADPPFLVSAFKRNRDAANYLLLHPDAERIKILYEACLGLSYLHSHNIIHGDLKASNILIDEHGSACLADFGLSKIKMRTTTYTQTLGPAQPVGTAQWMAPEHISTGTINKWTDIYSFGMTIYEIFTDKPPFPGIADFQHIKQIVYIQQQRPKDPRPDKPVLVTYGLDDNMWKLINQCWDAMPHARPSTSELQTLLRVQNMAGPTRPLLALTISMPVPEPFVKHPPVSSYATATRGLEMSGVSAPLERPRQSSFSFLGTFRKKKAGVEHATSRALTLLSNATTSSPFDISRLSPNPFPSATSPSSGMPLDVSLRLLLLHVPLSDQGDKLDQTVAKFADVWTDQYPGQMEPWRAHRLVFSFILANMDFYRTDGQRRSNKEEVIRELRRGGLDDVQSEYYYDNVTFAPFLYQEDLKQITANRGIFDHTPIIFSTGPIKKMTDAERNKTILVYSSLTQEKLQSRRSEVNAFIPQAEPFSYLPAHSGDMDVEECYMTCSHASKIEVIPNKEHPSGAFPALTAIGPNKLETGKTKGKGQNEVATLRLRKVGALEQKDIILGSYGSRPNAETLTDKWRQMGVALTVNELFFFQSVYHLATLKSAADAAARDGFHVPRRADFKPDYAMPLDGAVALYDTSYPECENVFRLVPREGPQYLCRVPLSSTGSELDQWIQLINYSASFRTFKLALRAAPRTGNPSHLAGSPLTLDSPFQSFSPTSDIGRRHSHSPSSSSLGEGSHLEGVQTGANGYHISPSFSRGTDINHLGPYSSGGSDSSLSAPRIAKVQQAIEQLNRKIDDLEKQLEPDLRSARNLAILTPFQPSIQEKLRTAIVPLAKRVQQKRIELARQRCYRSVLLADLAAGKRQDEMAGNAFFGFPGAE